MVLPPLHCNQKKITFKPQIKQLTKHFENRFPGLDGSYDGLLVFLATGELVGLHERQPDQDVHDGDGDHRDHEEGERRELEHELHPVPEPLGDVAQQRVRQRVGGTRVPDLIEQPGVDRVRQSTRAGDDPDEDDDLDGPGQAGQGLGPQRVADGHVAVDGEGRDRQDRGVGGQL